MHVKESLLCVVSAHVGDIKGAASKETADSLLKRINKCVGQRKADYDNVLHAGIQHESSSGGIFTHQYVYIDSITPIDAGLFVGKGGNPFATPSFMTHTGRSEELLHGLCQSGPN